jgi:hypothetical protein
MSDGLSSRSRAFLRSVQEADDPTREDFDRVRAGVKARLAASVAAGVAALVTAKAAAATEAATVTSAAAGATVATATAAVTTAAAGSGAAAPATGLGVALLTKVAAVVLVVGAAAGVTTAVVRRAPEVQTRAAAPVDVTPRDPPVSEARTPRAIPQAIAMPTPTPTAPVAATVAAPPPAAHAPSPATPPPVATETQPAPSSLDLEIALVREARAALRGGDAARSLALLDEHARRFPGGSLGEDCDAERIHALCALGRGDEARSLAARFLAAHPASPHAPSVRASCGGGVN